MVAGAPPGIGLADGSASSRPPQRPGESEPVVGALFRWWGRLAPGRAHVFRLGVEEAATKHALGAQALGALGHDLLRDELVEVRPSFGRPDGTIAVLAPLIDVSQHIEQA